LLATSASTVEEDDEGNVLSSH